MYEYFEFDIDNSRFEWDEEKDHLNFTKHGIHFKTAVKVFLDPNKMMKSWKGAVCGMHIKRKEYNTNNICAYSITSGKREV